MSSRQTYALANPLDSDYQGSVRIIQMNPFTRSRSWINSFANNEVLIKRWIRKHLITETVLLVVSFFIMNINISFGVYLFLQTIISIIGGFIPFFCLHTNLGWEMNILFQVISLFISVVLFLASIIRFTKGNVSVLYLVSLVVIICCCIVSILSMIPFIYLSTTFINARLTSVAPIGSENNNTPIHSPYDPIISTPAIAVIAPSRLRADVEIGEDIIPAVAEGIHEVICIPEALVLDQQFNNVPVPIPTASLHQVSLEEYRHIHDV